MQSGNTVSDETKILFWGAYNLGPDSSKDVWERESSWDWPVWIFVGFSDWFKKPCLPKRYVKIEHAWSCFYSNR